MLVKLRRVPHLQAVEEIDDALEVLSALMRVHMRVEIISCRNHKIDRYLTLGFSAS